MSGRTALVVSGDTAVRADWARYFEKLGMRALRCVGPAVTCALLPGETCPLHANADLAIYDQGSLTPELILKLIRVSRSLPVAFARDRIDAEGHHEPLVTGSTSGARTDACIGLPVDALGR